MTRTLIVRPGTFGVRYFLRDGDGIVRPVRLTVAQLERMLAAGVPVVREGVHHA